jgi:pimeloyl-ACP methyl ester carboxylesterase
MVLQPPSTAGRIAVPVRVIWGDRDSALEPGLAEESASLCDAVEIIHLPEATHWLHHEEIARVNALLLEFLLVADGGASRVGGDRLGRR